MDFKTGGMAGEIVLGELTGNVSPLELENNNLSHRNQGRQQRL
jgi:hypothetical protein